MKIESLHRAISRDLRALFPGAILTGPHKGIRYLREAVSFDTAHKIRIYPSGDCKRYFLLKRSVPFTYEEKELAAAAINNMCGGAHKCAASSAKKRL